MKKLGILIGVLGMIFFLAACAEDGIGTGSETELSPGEAVFGESLSESEVCRAKVTENAAAELGVEDSYSSAKDDDADTTGSFVLKRMTWYFSDQCEDWENTKVKLFDVKSGKSWGPWIVPDDGLDYYARIKCTKGNKICFGAWTPDLYWGCGPGCKYSCTNCCARCGAKTIGPINLSCN